MRNISVTLLTALSILLLAYTADSQQAGTPAYNDGD